MLMRGPDLDVRVLSVMTRSYRRPKKTHGQALLDRILVWSLRGRRSRRGEIITAVLASCFSRLPARVVIITAGSRLTARTFLKGMPT